jgi:hypothetical protein
VSERYREVTVDEALANQEPLALAFDQVYKIVAALPPHNAFGVLANVLAYGLKMQPRERRTEVLAEFNRMVLECLVANDRAQGKETRQ